MNLDPFSTPGLVALEAARQDFPGYRIDLELTVDRPRYIACRIHPGPDPRTLITSDLAELRRELRTSR